MSRIEACADPTSPTIGGWWLRISSNKPTIVAISLANHLGFGVCLLGSSYFAGIFGSQHTVFNNDDWYAIDT